MQLNNRDGESDFSSPPRRNTEEWHEIQLRIDGDIAFMEDKWLYHWVERGEPPEPFRDHRTLFRQCTPSEISKGGWRVLTIAMRELSKVFHVRLGPNGFPDKRDKRPTYKLEWLAMNRYYRCPCCLGLYGGECVVAATSASQMRPPFVPFDLYKVFHQNSALRNTRYQAGYRHFQALFDVGYSFYIEHQRLRCDVAYGVDVGVHSCGWVWAVINMDGVLIPAPYRIPLGTDLSDLPGKIGQINLGCQRFVQKLGASYLRAIDADSVYNQIRRYVRDTEVPHCVREELRTDPQLDRCYTRLDILKIIMKSMNLRPDDHRTTSLISLSQQFTNPQEKRNVNNKEER